VLRNEIERSCSRANMIEFFDDKKGWFSAFETKIKDWISFLIKRLEANNEFFLDLSLIW
jgi:hypothetical protein